MKECRIKTTYLWCHVQCTYNCQHANGDIFHRVRPHIYARWSKIGQGGIFSSVSPLFGCIQVETYRADHPSSAVDTTRAHNLNSNLKNLAYQLNRVSYIRGIRNQIGLIIALYY